MSGYAIIQLGKGEVPSKTGVVVVDNRSYGFLEPRSLPPRDVTYVAFFISEIVNTKNDLLGGHLIWYARKDLNLHARRH